MKRLLFALIMLTGPVAQAATDYQCLNQCTQAGYQYGLCQARCSYDQPTSGGYCVMGCVQAGNTVEQCQAQCGAR